MKCLQPNAWNRLLVLAVQGVFFNAYFLGYMASPRLCHRIAGYLEEEAVVSYTHFLDAIDKGIIPNNKAPQIALGKNGINMYISCIGMKLTIFYIFFLHRILQFTS
jgi:Alternative oxidase